MTDPLAERVQRVVGDELPVLHVETEVPRPPWMVRIEGAVRTTAAIGVEDIRRLPTIERTVDMHCVWGWSRPRIRWHGTTLDALAALVEPEPDADHVVIGAHGSPYASCLTLAEASAGIFAWEKDGAELATEHGGPMRFVPPATKWAYKSVKWVGRVGFTAGFDPGFWEEAVGDPRGDVPAQVLADFETQLQGRA